MPVTEIKTEKNDEGKRIDIFAASKTGISRSRIQKLIKNNGVHVGLNQVDQNYRVKYGDLITLQITEEKNTELVPEKIPIEILYKDEHIIVVDKPAGMVVYPAVGHNKSTLMNAVAYHCEKLAKAGSPLRPGVVHRLDKDTSGVMVVALEDKAYYNLAIQFKNRTIQKKYIALVYGKLKGTSGEISSKIGRSESDRKKMSTKARRGKEAVTLWKTIKSFNNATLIEVKLKTGRTHQIRVHFASIGHPVLGDKTYGKKTEMETIKKNKVFFPRQMLHAEMLGFTHPETEKYLEFKSPIPADMQQALKELET
jgi:23S rRNA pseudouridine1911/1915/1917 synthase